MQFRHILRKANTNHANYRRVTQLHAYVAGCKHRHARFVIKWYIVMAVIPSQGFLLSHKSCDWEIRRRQDESPLKLINFFFEQCGTYNRTQGNPCQKITGVDNDHLVCGIGPRMTHGVRRRSEIGSITPHNSLCCMQLPWVESGLPVNDGKGGLVTCARLDLTVTSHSDFIWNIAILLLYVPYRFVFTDW